LREELNESHETQPQDFDSKFFIQAEGQILDNSSQFEKLSCFVVELDKKFTWESDPTVMLG
jgi:hypothetical protein